MKKLMCIVVLLCAAFYLRAEVTLPNVISSNMVLQQQKPVPIWGTAAAGEQVTVSFAGQQKTAVADADGKWRVNLDPMKATPVPAEMTISGENTITLENVVIGEVWLASGQSNMEYAMRRGAAMAPPAKGEDLAALELEKPANPQIRVMLSTRSFGRQMPGAFGGMRSGWAEASGESLPRQSAVGYFFAKSLADQLPGVPIGIITAAVGGTRIEPWTTREAYLEDPRFAAEMQEKGSIDGARPNEMYDGLIAPLVPFALRGIIWYQGEQNQSQSDRRYDEKMEVLINSWRKAFENKDASFYYVLLAPHIYSDRLHRGHAVTADELPIFWEMQEKARLLPHCGMTVVSDLVDTLTDIHPSYKWEVGRRLSLHALAKDYGQKKLVYSGPTFKQVAAKGNTLEVSFDYVAKGLKIAGQDTYLKTFEIAGADGNFVPAKAVIKKKKVVVSSDQVDHPVSVRMGWHETFRPNLVNSAGLPAAPFRATVK